VYRLLSDHEHDTNAFFAVIPNALDIAQWNGPDFDGKLLFTRGFEELTQGLENLRKRSASESASEQFQAGTAQCGGLQRDAFARAVADLNISKARLVSIPCAK
jgi:hypothetical protein